MPVGRTKSFDKIGLVHRHLTHNRRANSVRAATKVFCSCLQKMASISFNLSYNQIHSFFYKNFFYKNMRMKNVQSLRTC